MQPGLRAHVNAGLYRPTELVVALLYGTELVVALLLRNGTCRRITLRNGTEATHA